MDKHVLKTAMKRWVAPDTWHTGHPCDEKRFNQSVQAALSQIVQYVPVEIWRQVFDDLVRELHPGFDTVEATRLIQEYASRADAISSFLSDTNQL